MKILKKNQVIIFVVALMLITAGYLNFTTQNKDGSNLLPTSGLADSEQLADIGDAQLVSANLTSNNQTTENKTTTNITNNSQTTNNENVNKNENTTATVPVKEDSYFTQSRLDRENMYSQTIANYTQILEESNVSSEQKEIAQKEIKKINDEKNAIMIAENLIKTKGLQDVVIFANNGSISIIVKAEKLEPSQVAQIQEIVTRELNVTANKINISNKK